MRVGTFFRRGKGVLFAVLLMVVPTISCGVAMAAVDPLTSVTVDVVLTPPIANLAAMNFSLATSTAGTTFQSATALNEAAAAGYIDGYNAGADPATYVWINNNGITTGSSPVVRFTYSIDSSLTGGQYPRFSILDSGIDFLDVNTNQLSITPANFILLPTYKTASGVTQYMLDVKFPGAGGGTVAIPAAGLTCTSDCYTPFNAGTSVTLSAVPDAYSVFSGWSGGGCSGTGNCVVPMNISTTVSANFIILPSLRISGTTPVYFDTLQAAYDGAPTGSSTIEAKAMTLPAGGLTMNGNKTITLKGGYDASYSTNTGLTTITGAVTIVSGALVTDNVVIN